MQAYLNSIHRLAWQWLMAFVACLSIALPAHAVNQDDLLPPEKAFAAEISRSGDKLQLTLDVAPGYYLYRDRIAISTTPADLTGKPTLPTGQEKNDPYFGKQVIYHGKQQIVIPLNPGAPADFQLNVRLQGCAEAGVCYPPYTHKLKVSAVSGEAGGKANAWLGGAATAGKSPAGNSELAAKGWLTTLGTFLLAGLGMAFTACMYPLLPIVSSLIAGQGATLTRGRGFLLSLLYVQGLALTYTAVGVVAGLTGSLLTVWLQQPAVVLAASALMVVFALSMFDLFTIQLPSALQSKLADTSNQLSGGKAVTVFLMGALSALLVGPCVAPPLALALGYIGSTGDAVLGGAALYAMALGLGLPLIVIGTFGGHVLPRAGNWMKAVKSAFGVVMLGLAIWLATPFLPAALVMLLWAALLIGSAVFLGAFDSLAAGAKASVRLGKALGLLLFLLGGAQLVGLLSGADNPRYPLKLIAASSAEGAASHAFQAIGSASELDAKLAEAKAAGKPLLLDFYADWCVACKEMEAEVFPQPQVAAKMGQFVLLRADVTANNAEHQALLKRFGLFGPPGIILFGTDGKEAQRIVGFTPAETFASQLAQVAH
ncbi:protein-disulfide reductase DsbD [Chromobacterium amazonense]|uniref:Thiol:disulfide interchange protein DsbD n=1 Tax=Chromobacterium amazonense TaxID=1382803 RepID=A0ABU8UXH7_9NEIS|nr:protein-disulfide reductase DsbD [Chromobacterium amazonense]MDQ4540910.1 protein-disulfide reductase DsbD [Chromobacterium amazonense]